MELVVLIDRPGFAALSESRVLKHSDVLSITEAADLLAQAQTRDERMQEEARVTLAEQRLRAHSAGVLQAQQEWASRLAAAEAARHVTLNDLAPTLVGIVVDAVSLVLKRADPQQLMDSALLAVADLLRQARWARLKVHPTRVEEAQRALGRLAVKGEGQMVTVIADPTAELHACVFETDVGIADASLDVQIGAIRVAVESAVAQLAEQRESAQHWRRRWYDTTPNP